MKAAGGSPFKRTNIVSSTAGVCAPLTGMPVLSEAVLVVVVVVVIEEIMQVGHEQLAVYRVLAEYAVKESWTPYGDHDNECP